MSDNDVCKTRKGRKINEETPLMSRLGTLLNKYDSLTQKCMRKSLKMYNLSCGQATISNNLKKLVSRVNS